MDQDQRKRWKKGYRSSTQSHGDEETIAVSGRAYWSHERIQLFKMESENGNARAPNIKVITEKLKERGRWHARQSRQSASSNIPTWSPFSVPIITLLNFLSPILYIGKCSRNSIPSCSTERDGASHQPSALKYPKNGLSACSEHVTCDYNSSPLFFLGL